MSWIPKFSFKQQDTFNGPLDNQEEAAKVAILEKAMKGRQPTDLLLRCTFYMLAQCACSDRRTLQVLSWMKTVCQTRFRAANHR